MGVAAMSRGYSELRNELVCAANGVDYAYRDTGGPRERVPLVLLQHFRGNLDNWDPALIDALAPARRVITFDNAGVGGSTGTTPDTIEQMARNAIAFITAMQFSQVDLLGAAAHVRPDRRRVRRRRRGIPYRCQLRQPQAHHKAYPWRRPRWGRRHYWVALSVTGDS